MYRLLGDLLMLRTEQGAGKNEQHLRIAFDHAPKGGLDIVWWIFKFERSQIQMQGLGYILRAAQLVGRKRIRQNRDPGALGNVSFNSSTCFAASSG